MIGLWIVPLEMVTSFWEVGTASPDQLAGLFQSELMLPSHVTGVGPPPMEEVGAKRSSSRSRFNTRDRLDLGGVFLPCVIRIMELLREGRRVMTNSWTKGCRDP